MEPTVQQFKVGDKVTTHKQGENWRYGGRMTDGASGVIVRLADEEVKVRLTDGDEWTYHPSELRPASETPQFKLGDTVKIIGPSNIGSNEAMGEVGKVTKISPRLETAWVATARAPQYYPLSSLAHATHPQTITLDGVTYALTPVQEAPAVEERREPKQGEVWRDDDDADYVLITGAHDEDGDPQVVTLGGGENPVGGCAYTYRDNLTYAYPTLAAAIADGALS